MSDTITLPTGKFAPSKPVDYSQSSPEKDPLEFLGKNGIKSIPGIVNPGVIIDKPRDWEYAYINPIDGFMGIRWCPSWVRTDTNVAAWQPAGADVYRVQRKGEAGAEVRTLVFTCSPNSQTIPIGDPVVIWHAADEVTVSGDTTHNLFGYSLQLKTKINISKCTPSPIYDTSGRQIIEIDTGVTLPVIDYLPPFFSGEFGTPKSTMQLRHWSFYANSTTKELRLPLPSAFQNIKTAVAAGGNAILGGNQWSPTNYDWSKDYVNFGASLVEELFRKECEGLADQLGNTDPTRLAVELENSVIHPWENFSSTPGYKALLSDVWYPTARTAWGQERTLIVKGPGGVNGALDDFDWAPPRGERAHLAVHAGDSGIISPGGPLTFTSISESDWLAGALRSKIDTLGFSGGGATSLKIEDPKYTVDKAAKLGRVLTSFYNNNLHTWYYGHMNSDPDFTPNVANVFVINAFNVEALFPEMKIYARRAGLISE